MFESLMCYIINSVCCLLYRNEYRSFVKSSNIDKLQEKKLFEIIDTNSACEYGKKYEFNNIKSISDFQNRVPLTTYEDYEAYLERIKKGEKNILTLEDVLLLEPTSGSISASKYIPYTASLKKEFQKALKPWIYNLYTENKKIKWGKSYWSITPATAKKKFTEGGIPVGFEEDSEYLGGIEKRLVDMIFAVPGSVAKESCMDEFYYKTALNLLKCRNLTLISVWNPTFMLLLLQYIQDNCDRLCEDIALKDKKRGSQLRKLITQKEYNKIWTKLGIISCWSDANAMEYAKRLKDLFPDALIQPKGLLATEGVISFPIMNEMGARLSVYSHFYEFLSMEDNKIYLAHELQKGHEYSVIITTSGGFYRYTLKDIITVSGFSGVFPLIKFVGKQDRVSDMFGEKLNEIFIRNSIETSGIEASFYMLAPEKDRYVLYIKSDKILNNSDGALREIEGKLRENFHYDYCRKLGQLKELRIYRLTGNPENEYINECVKKGQRLGDIKPVHLSLNGGWDRIFKGEYI
ncbi:MAG: GH3 auxin-responsive promoter family protein [Bacillota bacterium]|nr:GH3 auxin-responsive promoter family protein [Bacillota bacterium]